MPEPGGAGTEAAGRTLREEPAIPHIAFGPHPAARSRSTRGHGPPVRLAAARGALASPGTVPLATASGDAVPAGPVIHAVSTRWHPVLTVPAFLFTRHMVIVGASGTGKTNLMIRLGAGWYA